METAPASAQNLVRLTSHAVSTHKWVQEKELVPAQTGVVHVVLKSFMNTNRDRELTQAPTHEINRCFLSKAWCSPWLVHDSKQVCRRLHQSGPWLRLEGAGGRRGHAAQGLSWEESGHHSLHSHFIHPTACYFVIPIISTFSKQTRHKAVSEKMVFIWFYSPYYINHLWILWFIEGLHETQRAAAIRL